MSVLGVAYAPWAGKSVTPLTVSASGQCYLIMQAAPFFTAFPFGGVVSTLIVRSVADDTTQSVSWGVANKGEAFRAP